MQVIRAITEGSKDFVTRDGIAMDVFNAGGNAQVGISGTRLPGAPPIDFRPLPKDALKDAQSPRTQLDGTPGGKANLGIGYESRDQFKVDLISQQLWSGYLRAQKQAERATTIDQQQHVFVSTLSKEWQETLKEQVLKKLDRSPMDFGATAPIIRPFNFMDDFLRGGEKQEPPH
ncbi:MAG: hypothetical protein NNA25_03630 [Nitrospira sp.]|nr:hypothetical protein [Nitrospira sp.]